MLASPKTAIWILEDDPGLKFVYEDILGLKYELVFLKTVADLRNRLDEGRPDLLLADLRLPGESFIQYLRSADQGEISKISTMVISTTNDIDIVRECFALGATDYLIKPFHSVELLVKIERFIRQRNDSIHPADAKLINIDLASLKVAYGDASLHNLTLKELKIIDALAGAKNMTLSRSAIKEKVWGDVQVSQGTLDVHFSHIRPKLRSIGLQLTTRAPDQYQIEICGDSA